MVASGGDIDDVSLMTTVVMVVNDGDSGCTNYHCITDYSQNLTTQTTHIYSLIVSVGQESGFDLARHLWFKSPVRLLSSCWLRLRSHLKAQRVEAICF